MTRFLFPQSAILDILERSLWWVLSHEKFCYHPLLLLKICPLLWATLLSMHCSCMLMEERSIHRLILQYFATVSNHKWCHVCNWWFHFREDGTHYKTGQERIPVEITISNRQKQWCAGVLGSFLARQQFLPILVTLANLWHFAIFRGSPCPFLFLSVEFCEICYSCYFCHICCPIFSHSMKNSCYFCDFCEILGLTKALLDLFCFLLFLPYLLLNLSHRKKNSC